VLKKRNEKNLNSSYLESLLEVDKKSNDSCIDISEEQEKDLQSRFCEQMKIELSKVDFFFNENLRFYRNKLNKINDQLIFIQKNKHLSNFKDNLEKASKELYKEVYLMKVFIEHNLKAKTKIIKKFIKVSKICKYKLDINTIIQDFLSKTKLIQSITLISEIMAEIEQTFSSSFCDKYSFHAVKVLKD